MRTPEDLTPDSGPGESGSLTHLHVVRAWRDIARFETLSVFEQWRDIEHSWPPPLFDGLNEHPHIRIIGQELETATTSITAMLEAWANFQAEAAQVQTESPSAVVSDGGKADISPIVRAMLEVADLTKKVADCHQRIDQINARSQETARTVEADTRERYLRAYESLSAKIQIALSSTGQQALQRAGNFEIEILLLKFRLLALKLEATGRTCVDDAIPQDPHFRSILADYISGTESVRTQILYVLKVRMTADDSIIGYMRNNLAFCQVFASESAPETR